ncbi:uncharacterized protein L201_006565 [Kwoniella dendrophila CBS 6074]|uniref:Uncharacterized protein n=1 Tax=Kwoniella dendrophila CBS 6074 TaxID=1295534 RepID=A0AAX4K2M6_9TREE
MSDTRKEAEKDLETVTMSNDLEDSLGSALESSFNLPPPPPAPAKGVEKEHEITTIPEDTLKKAAESEPVEGLEEWKDTLEGYTKEWLAESSVAREKALATRKRIEQENADAEKKLKEEIEKKKKENLAKEKKKRDEEKLKLELEDEEKKSSSNNFKTNTMSSNREQKVKEAWELVGNNDKKQGESSTTPSSAIETDSRATTSKDDKKHHVKPLSYDPTTSTDPIPPVFQDPVSVSQTTSGAWEELSRGGSQPSGSSGSGSGSGEEVSRPQSNSEESENDLVNIPSSSSNKDKPSQPPSQPPSLTLSLFNPSQLTVKRVLAVIGINLFLPFVNGVFLGFGEIFAREVVRVGKLVLKGERTWYSFGRGAASRAGTGGVGLSGGF